MFQKYILQLGAVKQTLHIELGVCPHLQADPLGDGIAAPYSCSKVGVFDIRHAPHPLSVPTQVNLLPRLPN